MITVQPEEMSCQKEEEERRHHKKFKKQNNCCIYTYKWKSHKDKKQRTK